MLERINKLLKRLEFYRSDSSWYCPSCGGRRDTNAPHYPGCELKACLDKLSLDPRAALGEPEESKS